MSRSPRTRLVLQPQIRPWTTADECDGAEPRPAPYLQVVLDVWGSLGFARFRDTQIMTLDPNSTALDQAIDELQEVVLAYGRQEGAL